MHDVDSMHVDEGVLMALIDGESVSGDDSRSHIDACDDCTRRLEELRFADRSAKGALEALDTPSPWSEMPDALREAKRGAVTPINTASRAPRRTGRSVAAAAGLVFVLAGGAYAIPGLPVRSFVDQSIDALFGGDQGPADPGPSRVAVEPVDGAIRVVIQGATANLRVTVRSVSAVRASVSARDARFGIESGQIRVSDAAGDLTVEIPSTATGTVEVDGVPVVRSVNGVLTRLPAADESPAVIVVETAG
ncbi:MAG: hypothetical protein ACC682_13695 [Gemmatimonadota bacterium]